MTHGQAPTFCGASFSSLSLFWGAVLPLTPPLPRSGRGGPRDWCSSGLAMESHFGSPGPVEAQRIPYLETYPGFLLFFFKNPCTPM